MKLHKIKLKSNSDPAFRILIKTEIIESQFKSFSENIFRTQVSIYDGGFLWIYSAAYYFCNKSSVTDVRLGCIYGAVNHRDCYNV